MVSSLTPKKPFLHCKRSCISDRNTGTQLLTPRGKLQSFTNSYLKLVEYGNPYCSLGPRFHTVDSHHCSGSLVDQHLKRGDEPTKTHMPLLLMAEILHQLNMENLPFFTGFYKSKRWLALGFMNQQQYQREIPWISKQKWLPYLFVFIFIPPRWGYNFQPCDISSEVVRVFGIPKRVWPCQKKGDPINNETFSRWWFQPM